MSRPRYEHIATEKVPAGLRYDSASPADSEIQLEFGGDPASPSPHSEGAQIKRVRNTVTGRTTCFALATGADDQNAAARAFEGAKAKRAEEMNATRAKRSPRRAK